MQRQRLQQKAAAATGEPSSGKLEPSRSAGQVTKRGCRVQVQKLEKALALNQREAMAETRDAIAQLASAQQQIDFLNAELKSCQGCECKCQAHCRPEADCRIDCFGNGKRGQYHPSD